jgi:lipopolysaccharide heptosyltransferase I
LRLSAIGDVLRTLPAVKALKEHDPSSHITWVVEEPSQGLLESQPEIDEVILFPRRRWTQGLKSPRAWYKTAKEVRAFVQALRQKQFDLALDFHGMLKSGLISFCSGSRRRIGFDRRSTKEGNSLFSNVKVVLPREEISRYRRNLLLLRGIGLEIEDFKPSLHLSVKDWKWADSFFSQLPNPLRRPFIVIHPLTSQKTRFKRWLPDRYAQLADRLVRELGAGVLYTWGPGELEWVKKVRNLMEEPSFLAPRTESLTQLGEIFRRCDLYIGGDTGPLHVASFVGTPIVAIFGPTHPVENEPIGPHRAVRKDVGCNPCHNYSCEDLACMRSVTVDDVFGAVREILAERGARKESA